ncbi:MAG: hypothetical protein U1F76_13720 [Candidatus Competibacteraceae bacterium]
MTLLLLFNAYEQAVPFVMPPVPVAHHWAGRLDTADPEQPAGARIVPAGGHFTVEPRSLSVFELILDG